MKKLIDTVNSVGDGWLASLVTTGAHAGLAYEVSHHGRVVQRISGHAKSHTIALVQAQAELRRNGCPLPDHHRKRGANVPAPSVEERRRSATLRPRLEEAVREEGGTPAMGREAVALLAKDAPEYQWGGPTVATDPVTLAQMQLKKFLGDPKAAMTNVGLERWEKVLEIRESYADGQPSSNGHAGLGVSQDDDDDLVVGAPPAVEDVAQVTHTLTDEQIAAGPGGTKDDPASTSDSELLALAEEELVTLTREKRKVEDDLERAKVRHEAAESRLEIAANAHEAALESAQTEAAMLREQREHDLAEAKAATNAQLDALGELHAAAFEKLRAKHEADVEKLTAAFETAREEDAALVDTARGAVAAVDRLSLELSRAGDIIQSDAKLIGELTQKTSAVRGDYAEALIAKVKGGDTSLELLDRLDKIVGLA